MASSIIKLSGRAGIENKGRGAGMPSGKKGKPNRIVLLVFVLLALVALAILSSIPGSPLNRLTSPFSFVLDPVQKGITSAWEGISGFWRSVTEAGEIQEENESLRNENAELRRQVNALTENGRRYEELKSAFRIKDDFADFEVLAARILTEEIGIWFDVLKIDLGIRDGIGVTEQRTFPVLDAQSNLVGRVLSSDAVSAKVLLLTGEGFSASARIVRTDGAIVRVRGDVTLTDDGLCRIDRIPAGASIRTGDRLVTSGLGGVFPPGIPIGTVVSVDENAVSLERTAVLKPYTVFGSVDTVFVMIGKGTA